MGLLHIPRVLIASARGYLRGRSAAASAVSASALDGKSGEGENSGEILGVGPSNPHLYRARCGLFDVDLNMHMNHASYLTHAELARWQMMAENGALGKMFRERQNFFVTGCAVRYRKEIGPNFRSFEIRTHVASIDRRNMWLYHTFRYPGDDGVNGASASGGSGERGNRNRKVLAQILVQAVCVKGRTVVPPRAFLEGTCGVDAGTVARLSESYSDDLMRDKRSRFEELEEALRASATADDNYWRGEDQTV